MVGNLGTQVAALLGRRIVAGDLSPGTTLPTEAELCENFNVSRTTVREALKKLHGKGLIAGTTRSGTRVLPTGRWNQLDSDLLTWQQIRHGQGPAAGALRDPILLRAGGLPLRRDACDDEDHAHIRQAYGAMVADREYSARVMEADLEFHMAIVDATHNRFFVTLGQAVKTALRVSFSLLQSRPGIPENELVLHSAIAERSLPGGARTPPRRCATSSRSHAATSTTGSARNHSAGRARAPSRQAVIGWRDDADRKPRTR